MPTDAEAKRNGLLDYIIAFEDELQVPVVSGELAIWLEDVNRAAENLESFLEPGFLKRHEDLYKEIGSEDPGLSSKIEDEMDEEKQLVAEFRDWRRRLQLLSENAEKLEPDEAIRTETLPNLVEKGLDFAGRLRRQEITVVTWLNEALNRMRGEVD